MTVNHDVVGSSPTAGATKHSLGMLFLHCKNIIKTKLFSCAVWFFNYNDFFLRILL
ncbi:hypothetical protein ANG3_1275 [Streptococcus intermedius SK54 = ATCC 27335]|nr:hypothetical protein ANG1_1281 [Streptococcus anginosus SK52 = DSM 20563]GAD40812.1 hypothetical protein ANG3_1275 [Streptococcus intermedius SK54 = ATCC 27335]